MKIYSFAATMLTVIFYLIPAQADAWTDVLEIICDAEKNSLSVKELRIPRDGPIPADKADILVRQYEGLKYKEAGPRGNYNLPIEETVKKVMGGCQIGYGKYNRETQKLSQAYNVIITRVGADAVTPGKCGAAAGVAMDIEVDGTRVAHWPSRKNRCMEGVSAAVFDGQSTPRSFRIGYGTSPFEMGIKTCGENTQTRESYPQSGSESYIEMQVNLSQCRSGTIDGFKVWEAGRAERVAAVKAERLEQKIAAAVVRRNPKKKRPD